METHKNQNAFLPNETGVRKKILNKQHGVLLSECVIRYVLNLQNIIICKILRLFNFQ